MPYPNKNGQSSMYAPTGREHTLMTADQASAAQVARQRMGGYTPSATPSMSDDINQLLRLRPIKARYRFNDPKTETMWNLAHDMVAMFLNKPSSAVDLGVGAVHYGTQLGVSIGNELSRLIPGHGGIDITDFKRGLKALPGFAKGKAVSSAALAKAMGTKGFWSHIGDQLGNHQLSQSVYDFLVENPVQAKMIADSVVQSVKGASQLVARGGEKALGGTAARIATKAMSEQGITPEMGFEGPLQAAQKGTRIDRAVVGAWKGFVKGAHPIEEASDINRSMAGMTSLAQGVLGDARVAKMNSWFDTHLPGFRAFLDRHGLGSSPQAEAVRGTREAIETQRNALQGKLAEIQLWIKTNLEPLNKVEKQQFATYLQGDLAPDVKVSARFENAIEKWKAVSAQSRNALIQSGVLTNFTGMRRDWGPLIVKYMGKPANLATREDVEAVQKLYWDRVPIPESMRWPTVPEGTEAGTAARARALLNVMKTGHLSEPLAAAFAQRAKDILHGAETPADDSDLVNAAHQEVIGRVQMGHHTTGNPSSVPAPPGTTPLTPPSDEVVSQEHGAVPPGPSTPPQPATPTPPGLSGPPTMGNVVPTGGGNPLDIFASKVAPNQVESDLPLNAPERAGGEPGEASVTTSSTPNWKDPAMEAMHRSLTDDKLGELHTKWLMELGLNPETGELPQLKQLGVDAKVTVPHALSSYEGNTEHTMAIHFGPNTTIDQVWGVAGLLGDAAKQDAVGVFAPASKKATIGGYFVPVKDDADFAAMQKIASDNGQELMAADKPGWGVIPYWGGDAKEFNTSVRAIMNAGEKEIPSLVPFYGDSELLSHADYQGAVERGFPRAWGAGGTGGTPSLSERANNPFAPAYDRAFAAVTGTGGEGASPALGHGTLNGTKVPIEFPDQTHQVLYAVGSGTLGLAAEDELSKRAANSLGIPPAEFDALSVNYANSVDSILPSYDGTHPVQAPVATHLKPETGGSPLLGEAAETAKLAHGGEAMKDLREGGVARPFAEKVPEGPISPSTPGKAFDKLNEKAQEKVTDQAKDRLKEQAAGNQEQNSQDQQGTQPLPPELQGPGYFHRTGTGPVPRFDVLSDKVIPGIASGDVKLPGPGYTKGASLMGEAAQDTDPSSVAMKRLGAEAQYRANVSLLDALGKYKEPWIPGTPLKPGYAPYNPEGWAAAQRGMLEPTLTGQPAGSGTLLPGEEGQANWQVPVSVARTLAAQHPIDLLGKTMLGKLADGLNGYVKPLTLPFFPSWQVQHFAGDTANMLLSMDPLATTGYPGTYGIRGMSRFMDKDWRGLIPPDITNSEIGGASDIVGGLPGQSLLNKAAQPAYNALSWASGVRRGLLFSDLIPPQYKDLSSVPPDVIANVRDIVNEAMGNYHAPPPLWLKNVGRVAPFSRFAVDTTNRLWNLPGKYPLSATMLMLGGREADEANRKAWADQGVDRDQLPEWQQGYWPTGKDAQGRVTAVNPGHISPYTFPMHLRDSPASTLTGQLSAPIGAGLNWLSDRNLQTDSPYKVPGVVKGMELGPTKPDGTQDVVKAGFADQRPNLLGMEYQSIRPLNMLDQLLTGQRQEPGSYPLDRSYQKDANGNPIPIDRTGLFLQWMVGPHEVQVTPGSAAFQPQGGMSTDSLPYR